MRLTYPVSTEREIRVALSVICDNNRGGSLYTHYKYTTLGLDNLKY